MPRDSWRSPGARILTTPLVIGIVAAVALVTGSSLAYAQSTPDRTVAAQNPAPINVLEVDSGYLWDNVLGSQNVIFNRISYKGSLVTSSGTPFKYASSPNIPDPAPTTGMGDRNSLALRFERGTTTIGGGLFEFARVQPLTLRVLESLNLRGTAFLGADADFKTVQLAIGLESPPFRVPGFQNTSVSNWIVFGLSANQGVGVAGGNPIQGLLTYRAFLGQAFGWHPSADIGSTTLGIAQEILKVAPTYAKAKDLAATIQENTKNHVPTRLQSLIVEVVGEADERTDDKAWQDLVRRSALPFAQAIFDRPTIAFYAEFSGWYTFTGVASPEFKSLLAASLDWWYLPVRDDVFLRVRYENGYELAVPTVRKDRLMVSFSFRL